MLSSLKLYFIGAAVIGILTLGGVIYWKGGHDTKVNIEAKQNVERLDTIKKAKTNEDNVDKMPESDLDRSLDKWMRD